jgi:hypothetical protein
MSGRSHLVAALFACGLVLSGGSTVARASEAGASAAPAALTDNPDSTFDAGLLEDLADGRLDSWSLADAALVASGINNDFDLARYRARLAEVIQNATAHVSRSGSPVRRAHRLLSELHRVALHRYEASTDRFTDLLDTGTFNCVSASLLYIIAARQIGLAPAAAETPLHVFVVLEMGARHIEIETTSPTGFDVRRDLSEFRSFILANKYVTPEELAQRGLDAIFNEFNNLTHPVTPEHAIAFLYHNAGLRALQAGQAGTAARDLISAVRIYPKLGYRSDDLRRTLAWSVRELYDAGDYLGAFRVAEVSMRMFPDRTTVRERFVAVGARIVEDAVGRGDVASAEQFEARTAALLQDIDALHKLEAFTAPAMARAALLERDWPAARRHAARFRAASADPVEAERFVTWVESRVAEGTGAKGAEVSVGAFEAEVRAALAAVPDGQDPHDYAAVVRGIATLAERGRYDEALAVGKVQRSVIASAATPAAPSEGLEALMKAVAGRQVAGLLRDRRWKEAGAAVDSALAQWPGDTSLIALRHQTLTVMSEDPWRLGAWPDAVLVAAAPGESSAHAGPQTSGMRR